MVTEEIWAESGDLRAHLRGAEGDRDPSGRLIARWDVTGARDSVLYGPGWDEEPDEQEIREALSTLLPDQLSGPELEALASLGSAPGDEPVLSTSRASVTLGGNRRALAAIMADGFERISADRKLSLEIRDASMACVRDVRELLAAGSAEAVAEREVGLPFGGALLLFSQGFAEDGGRRYSVCAGFSCDGGLRGGDDAYLGAARPQDPDSAPLFRSAEEAARLLAGPCATGAMRAAYSPALAGVRASADDAFNRDDEADIGALCEAATTAFDAFRSDGRGDATVRGDGAR